MASTVYCTKRLAQYGGLVNDGNRWFVIRDRKRVTVIDQGGEAIAIRAQHLKDKDDPITDYYGGSYFPNITQAVRWAWPSPS